MVGSGVSVVIAGDQAEGKDEEGDEGNEGGPDGDVAESADDIVCISASWGCDPDGGNQGSSLVIRHLLGIGSRHGDVS